MFCKPSIARVGWIAIAVCALPLLGQTTPRANGSAPVLEFPVFMRQNVVAGKTSAGSKVETKLAVATLVNGAVIPAGAILTGEVTESRAKSGNEPCRLAVRIDSARWNQGQNTSSIGFGAGLYLTGWVYPTEVRTDENAADGPVPVRHGSTQHIGGSAPYPNPNTQDSPVYTKGNTGKTAGRGSGPSTTVSPHLVLMKNVEVSRAADGSVALTSVQGNIKLDKSTIYVLAAQSLLPSK